MIGFEVSMAASLRCYCLLCGGNSLNALSTAWLMVLAFRCGLELRALVATPRQIIALREASHTSSTSVPWVTLVGRVVDDVTPNPRRLG